MGTDLNYQQQGEGFPLILLHGNGESLEYFQKQIPEFSKSYRVIALDTAGHGKSPRGTGPFTLERFAEDLKAFMDEKGIEKAHILGFSDGGNIALLFALKYPERVEKLILNGANLNTKGVKPGVQLPIILGYGLLSAICAIDKKGIPKKELLGLMVTQPNIDPVELSGLSMPVLVIAGTKDMIKSSHTELIASSIPNARLIFLPGDHFIAAKNSPEFNKAVSDFLCE